VTAEPFLGVLLVDLQFPENHSLKGKRSPISSLRDVIHGRFQASFSEVGFQQTWQRTRVLVTLAASSAGQATERLDDIDRYLHGREFEVSRVLVKNIEAVKDLWDFDS
jgi:uncharacterized protein YlxP (DUF503 family)